MIPLFMLTAQVATEAVKSSGDPATWIAVAVLAVSSMAGWLKVIFIDGRKAKAEADRVARADEARDQAMAGYPDGTVGAILRDHAGQLTTHGVEIKNICERMAEIRTDNINAHDKLFGKIDTIKDQIFDKIDELRKGK